MAFEISSDTSITPSSRASGEPRATGTMETVESGTSGIVASRIALGTWAIGGWMWGGNSDQDESIDTIRSAVERGITLIDTAPAYGFGRSEEIVGMALSGGLRERVVIATKVGLEWRDGKVWRNSSPPRIRKEAQTVAEQGYRGVSRTRLELARFTGTAAANSRD